MDRFHRYYALHAVLTARSLPVSRRQLELKLECSRATVKRLVEDLRGYGVPIGYDRQRNGYFLDRSQAYELPGIWFNASELYASPSPACWRIPSRRSSARSGGSSRRSSSARANCPGACAFFVWEGAAPAGISSASFAAEVLKDEDYVARAIAAA